MQADRAPQQSSAQPPRRRREKRQRNKITPVRWASEEFNAVAAKADKAGLPLGAYLRSLALGHAGPRAQRRPPAGHVALRQILGQLGRAGNNINQIARSINYGDLGTHRGLTLPAGSLEIGKLLKILYSTIVYLSVFPNNPNSLCYQTHIAILTTRHDNAANSRSNGLIHTPAEGKF